MADEECIVRWILATLAFALLAALAVLGSIWTLVPYLAELAAFAGFMVLFHALRYILTTRSGFERFGHRGNSRV